MIVPLKEVRGAVSGAAIAVPLRARSTVLATRFTDGRDELDHLRAA